MRACLSKWLGFWWGVRSEQKLAGISLATAKRKRGSLLRQSYACLSRLLERTHNSMGYFAYSNYNSTRRVEITQKKERGNLTGRVHSTCRGVNGPRMHHVIIARWKEPAPKRKRLFQFELDWCRFQFSFLRSLRPSWQLYLSPFSWSEDALPFYWQDKLTYFVGEVRRSLLKASLINYTITIALASRFPLESFPIVAVAYTTDITF